jgi:uracil-DNA glycosylase family 4
VPTTLEELAIRASTCTACRLAEGRTQVVFGMGDHHADLMFVGEGPGAEEDKQGLPFVGRSGQLLDRLIAEELGRTRLSCRISNTTLCRPPGNRDPRPDEVKACSGWLDAQLELVDPKVVITLGNFASKALLQTDTGITKLRGKAYPFRGGWLVPTFHPAAALRGGGAVLSQMRSDFVRAKLLLTGAHVG